MYVTYLYIHARNYGYIIIIIGVVISMPSFKLYVSWSVPSCKLYVSYKATSGCMSQKAPATYKIHKNLHRYIHYVCKENRIFAQEFSALSFGARINICACPFIWLPEIFLSLSQSLSLSLSLYILYIYIYIYISLIRHTRIKVCACLYH